MCKKTIWSGALVLVLAHSKSCYLQAAKGLLGPLFNPTLWHYRTLLFLSTASCQQGLSCWLLTQGESDMYNNLRTHCSGAQNFSCSG